ncbi:hypothetical protein O181_090309 [Austropuccinia psidii MF-1]|uniref:Manganese/iron superoxide dismutase C-terminal domain-containing protein n=1 Tax=Austropuccinia psidii MF-1 TaxID=1389203 RepID=A0A9Q3P6T3_9BASI|nr:hypothetical protein [Austropuccinia psidii MF-1]
MNKVKIQSKKLEENPLENFKSKSEIRIKVLKKINPPGREDVASRTRPAPRIAMGNRHGGTTSGTQTAETVGWEQALDLQERVECFDLFGLERFLAPQLWPFLLAAALSACTSPEKAKSGRNSPKLKSINIEQLHCQCPPVSQPLCYRPSCDGRRAVCVPLPPLLILQNRSVHSMPQLRHEGEFAANGIPGFMSPDAYRNTTFAQMDTVTLVKSYAKERKMAPVFNYASMAHNNHFFFNGLSPVEVPIPNKLLVDMTESGSSPESLKQDFLAAASAQFGGGFVWLVSDNKNGLLRILNTYSAGTPYSEAFARQQPVDTNTEPVRKSTGWLNTEALGDRGGSVNVAPGGLAVTPLLCVNTWEHAWLFDYGFGGEAGGGKDEYLERWWDRVDWNLVENAHKEAPGYPARMR